MSINGACSERLHAISGVPQGSHLGPLLFNVFINDLPSILQHIKVLIYADDAKFYCPIFSEHDPLLCQNNLDRVAE